MADSVETEAIGIPGKRTFKITAVSPRGSVIVWLEKEQLLRVGLAIKRFLAARPAAAQPAPRVEEVWSGSPVEAEFKAGEMSLRYDASTGVLTLEAAGIEPQPDSEPPDLEEPPVTVEFSFTSGAGAVLADRALEICAAGRKACPLCGGPMDPDGHFCVRTNGHQARGLPSE